MAEHLPLPVPNLTPENADGHNDDAVSQKSDVPIELSDSDEEDWVEVVEDDDDELGACDVLNLFRRSVN
jgi:hypothetical protein